MFRFYTSDLKVLCRLFAKKKHQIVVFNPFCEIKVNLPFSFKLFKTEEDLEKWIVLHDEENIFLINFSDQDLSTIYGLAHVVSHLKFGAKSKNNNDLEFFFINNSDGTMRWVFPTTNTWSSHLQLYNASGWKAKVYRKASAILFSLGRQKILTNGRFSIRSKEPILLQKCLEDIEYDQYSIFTGTVSTGRKAIMEISKDKEVKHFLKIPIEAEAYKYLQREFEELQEMKQLSFKYLVIPGVQKTPNGILLENIKPSQSRNSVELEPMHFDALEEIYDQTFQKAILKDLPVFSEISKNLQEIQDCQDQIFEPLSYRQMNGIIEKLNGLYTSNLADLEFNVARAHGDFTPWNMYLTDSHLHLYDWELARDQMPMLLDCFHFIFQTGILIRSFSWTEISQQLKALHQSSFFGRLTQKHSIDFDIYLRVYLLYTVSSYLPRYIRQKPLHQQAFWLLDVWEAALDEMVEKVPEIEENTASKTTEVR